MNERGALGGEADYTDEGATLPVWFALDEIRSYRLCWSGHSWRNPKAVSDGAISLREGNRAMTSERTKAETWYPVRRYPYVAGVWQCRKTSEDYRNGSIH